MVFGAKSKMITSAIRHLGSVIEYDDVFPKKSFLLSSRPFF